MKENYSNILSADRIDNFRELILGKNKVAIFTHVNPDGDAIGSALAFQLYLNSKHIKSQVFIASMIPESLLWLEGSRNVAVKPSVDDVKRFLEKTDLIVCLDFNEPERVDYLSELLTSAKVPVLVIDHHPQVHSYKGLSICNLFVSSTAELLFWLLKSDSSFKFDARFATAIYTGILTDTGSFSYNCSHPHTFKTVAELLETGFDKDEVTDRVFQQFSESRMRLLGHLLANRMMIMPKFKSSYTYLTKDDMKTFSHQSGDTEGFVNYPLSIKNVDFTALFIEHDNFVKISFRSKGKLAANEFAKRFFNGGGHRNAAGGRTSLNLADALKHFEELVKKHIHEF